MSGYERPGFFPRRRVSPVLQTEAAECGLACVAMILDYHGRNIPVAELRRAWPVSLHGMTLGQLAELAAEQGLAARPLRLEPDELSKLGTPCVLHWGLDHFVVLERVRASGIDVVDPAIGRRRLDAGELSRLFTGVAIELAPAAGFERRARKPAPGLSRFVAGSRGLARPIAQLLAVSAALQVFMLLTPFYTQLVIDEVVVSGDKDLLGLAAVSFAALAVFIAASSALRAWIIVHIGASLSFGWSSALFDHLVRLPFDWFVKRHVGDIQSRFGSLGAVRELVTTQAVAAVIDGLMAASTLIVMLLYSPVLAAVSVSAVCIYLSTRLLLFPCLRAADLERIVRNAIRDSYFLESLRGIVAIRNFATEQGRRLGFESRLAQGIGADAKVSRITIWQDVASRLVFGVESVVVIWLAAAAIIDGRMTAGMMVAFLAYRMHFSSRSAALVDKLFQYRLVHVHLERLADIVDTPREETGARPGPRRMPMEGRLALAGVGHRYGRNQPPVLEGVNLTVDAGEQLAITGPSGCGKSTLFRIMAGLVPPTEGRIAVDDSPLADFGLARYRRMIGVVMQDDQLLGGTLLDNIACFETSPDIAAVEACCRLAGVEEDIGRMPMGLHTLVGDMGDVLSGGQRQRVLLARALYRKPSILFLDEATSHLDAARETEIVERIARLPMTRIVVAHRAETLRHADRVVTLARPPRSAVCATA